jgi:hypothetical protein
MDNSSFVPSIIAIFKTTSVGMSSKPHRQLRSTRVAASIAAATDNAAAATASAS